MNNRQTCTIWGNGKIRRFLIKLDGLLPGASQAITIPLFLAGGLNAGNITVALRTVEPFSVDVCSGVRTNGRLDEQKLASFFKQIASVV